MSGTIQEKLEAARKGRLNEINQKLPLFHANYMTILLLICVFQPFDNFIPEFYAFLVVDAVFHMLNIETYNLHYTYNAKNTYDYGTYDYHYRYLYNYFNAYAFTRPISLGSKLTGELSASWGYIRREDRETIKIRIDGLYAVAFKRSGARGWSEKSEKEAFGNALKDMVEHAGREDSD